MGRVVVVCSVCLSVCSTHWQFLFHVVTCHFTWNVSSTFWCFWCSIYRRMTLLLANIKNILQYCVHFVCFMTGILSSFNEDETFRLLLHISMVEQPPIKCFWSGAALGFLLVFYNNTAPKITILRYGKRTDRWTDGSIAFCIAYGRAGTDKRARVMRGLVLVWR